MSASGPADRLARELNLIITVNAVAVTYGIGLLARTMLGIAV